MALVVHGAVDQMHDVEDLVITICLKQLRLGAVLQILGELLEQICQGPAQPLDVFEVIGAGAGTAGVLDLFCPADTSAMVRGGSPRAFPRSTWNARVSR